MQLFLEWLWRFLVSLDQLCNVLFSPILNFVLSPKIQFGNPDETLSSVFGKNIEAGACRGCYYVCKLLSLIDPRHCEESIERDE